MHIWARGYFVDIVGVDRESIKNYAKEQHEGPNKRGAIAPIERQQRMTRSGVVVPRKPPTRSVVVY